MVEQLLDFVKSSFTIGMDMGLWGVGIGRMTHKGPFPSL